MPNNLSNSLNSLMAEESKIAQETASKVMPKTVEYIKHTIDELHAGNPDEAMQMMIQHTKLWGVANVIVAELDNMVQAMSQTHRHGLKSHPVVAPEEKEVLKRVFMAKILHEIFGGLEPESQQFGFVDTSKGGN